MAQKTLYTCVILNVPQLFFPKWQIPGFWARPPWRMTALSWNVANRCFLFGMYAKKSGMYVQNQELCRNCVSGWSCDGETLMRTLHRCATHLCAWLEGDLQGGGFSGFWPPSGTPSFLPWHAWHGAFLPDWWPRVTDGILHAYNQPMRAAEAPARPRGRVWDQECENSGAG